MYHCTVFEFLKKTYNMSVRFFVLCIICVGALAVNAGEQVESVQGLISRVLGTVNLTILADGQKYVNYFDLKIVEKENPHRDFWVLESDPETGHLSIQGTTGIAIANGLYMS